MSDQTAYIRFIFPFLLYHLKFSCHGNFLVYNTHKQTYLGLPNLDWILLSDMPIRAPIPFTSHTGAIRLHLTATNQTFPNLTRVYLALNPPSFNKTQIIRRSIWKSEGSGMSSAFLFWLFFNGRYFFQLIYLSLILSLSQRSFVVSDMGFPPFLISDSNYLLMYGSFNRFSYGKFYRLESHCSYYSRSIW